MRLENRMLPEFTPIEQLSTLKAAQQEVAQLQADLTEYGGRLI